MKAPGTQAEHRIWQCLCCISDNRNSSALGLSNRYADRAPVQNRVLGWCWVSCGSPGHSRQLWAKAFCRFWSVVFSWAARQEGAALVLAGRWHWEHKAGGFEGEYQLCSHQSRMAG